MSAPQRQLGPSDDLEMINSPELWPYAFYLPMKNYKRVGPGEFPDTGIIIALRPTRLYLGTLGMTNWGKADFIDYASVEDLLEAGWQVD
jgi:hypothetical protein